MVVVVVVVVVVLVLGNLSVHQQTEQDKKMSAEQGILKRGGDDLV